MKPLTPLIDGNTHFIAHIGFPTHSFKAPLIYNPYFADAGINVVVVPMACEPAQFEGLIRAVLPLPNCKGALITMPHKVTAMGLASQISPVARVAGACNAMRCGDSGEIVADMFDGAGFVRGVQRKGFDLQGKRVLVVGTGGVGSAIAASLAAEKIAEISLFDVNTASSEALGRRLQTEYPQMNQTLCREHSFLQVAQREFILKRTFLMAEALGVALPMQQLFCSGRNGKTCQQQLN